jgi:PKD repeat protein
MRYNAQVLICTVLLTSASCSKDELTIQAAPISDFTVPASLEALVAISFQNTSENADEYSWTFGDGSSSQDTNPVHTYAKPGNYQVTLTATRGAQTATSTKTITISAYDITTNIGARFAGNYLCKVIYISNTPGRYIKTRLADKIVTITRQGPNKLGWDTFELTYSPWNFSSPQPPTFPYLFINFNSPPRTSIQARFHTSGDSAVFSNDYTYSPGGSTSTTYHGIRQN